MPHQHHDRFGNPKHFADYVRRLGEPARDEWQKPGQVIEALKLRRRHVVADVGAGTGYFSLRLAPHVRHVFASEVEQRLLGVLVEAIAGAGVSNVTPILALPGDPLLPASACDLVLIVNTFHHFPDPPAYLRKLARSLRARGRIVNIDFHDHVDCGGHKTTREDFLRAAAEAGLRLIDEHRFLPRQYFLVLQPGERAAGGERGRAKKSRGGHGIG